MIYFNGNWYNSENKFSRSDFIKRAAIQANYVAPINNPPTGYYPNTGTGGPTNINPDGSCKPPFRSDDGGMTAVIDMCTNSPGTGSGCRGEYNWWCGSKMSNKINGQVDDTLGLMVVSCILSGLAWLFMVMISQGNPTTQRKYFYESVCGCMGAASFFSMCAVSVFDASGLKTTFCGVFDPDSNTGVYCGYYDGFFAVSSLTFFAGAPV